MMPDGMDVHSEEIHLCDGDECAYRADDIEGIHVVLPLSRRGSPDRIGVSLSGNARNVQAGLFHM